MRNQVLLELRTDLINNKKLPLVKILSIVDKENYKHINFALTISIYRKLNTKFAFDNGGFFLYIITKMRK